MIRLNAEWTDLMHGYEEQHADPRNQACHKIGIPLIAASLPIGATVVGLPLAATMFTVGWGFQFVGHDFEGKKPVVRGRQAEPHRRPTLVAEEVGRRGRSWLLDRAATAC